MLTHFSYKKCRLNRIYGHKNVKNTNALLKISFSTRQEIEGMRIYISCNHRNINEDASQTENGFLKDEIVHALLLVNVD